MSIEDTLRRIVREELDRGASAVPRLALTIPEAAASVGYSLEGLRQQIRAGYLVPSYANSKPVVMVDELKRWLTALPAEPR